MGNASYGAAVQVRFIAATLLALATSAVAARAPNAAGRFAVGSTTVTVLDASRAGRTLVTEVWYPAEAAGRDTQLRRGRFPLVGYRLGAADAQKLARAIGLTAEIFFAGGAREVYSGVHSRPVLHSIDDARALQTARLPAADFEMMAFHPQGTARMGEDRRRAVTDSAGRVHGTPGLWVGDASLFPSSCKVNPQITIMALATRLAEHLAADM